jgi:prepilin-type N-terminal cleavage/methylation domain-containing protein
MMTPSPDKTQDRSGFTLTELLLAMLVFAIAITTILALLARSIETVDEVLLKDEAMRLSSAVEDFFENQDFNTSYRNSLRATKDQIQLVAFSYRGIPDDVHTSGTLKPYVPLDGTVNEDWVLTPWVGYRLASDVNNTELNSVIRAQEGRLFLVRLRVSPNNPVTASLPNFADTYPSAVLVLYAEYYPVSSLNNMDVDALGTSPAFSYTFAIRR